ncbi:sporulation protein YabP [Haloplasma contractile]|uniref:Sporulation protein YabP n=1 Tax=Haloplasma contractile SSD-17B TaxID=1033810 RepID=U2ECD8_9MOLU|nr:sporulation protein YabP [Haloplasma contractile]ERJ12436.1 Sporulation protein YabP [Haloplasma contractile SSD-17B]
MDESKYLNQDFIQTETSNRNQNHHMMIRDRKSIEITGVKKIESLNSEEFVLETILGYMTISGQDLEMMNLSIDKGEILIAGYVTAIEYYDHEEHGDAPKSFINKLFK